MENIFTGGFHLDAPEENYLHRRRTLKTACEKDLYRRCLTKTACENASYIYAAAEFL